MSIVYCPKCKSPNDDGLLDGSWLVCAICSNRWFPSAATIDSLPTAEIPQAKPKPAAKPVTTPGLPGVVVTRSGSGEYLPDEPDSQTIAKPALTEKVEGRQSGLQPAVRSAPIIAAVTREAKPRPARAPRQAAHDPETGPTIDSDLFDRLEGEARYNRSEMKTVPEIVFDDPAKYRTSVPHSDHSAQVTCPVCGHNYVSSGTHHVCPQCGTAYDEDTNVVTAGPGSKDDLIGRTLRGCLIDRKLGEGGMGAVYHAKQLSLDRSVAVKVLPVDLARNKNFIQRFEREAKSLAKLNHPNILQIYDFGDDPQLGLYFMIIEYVEGLDLGEVLNRRGLLGQIEVLDLLRQSVMGLEAAAEKGVIHRDIKPDNLMISANGLVKVSDFGLAKGYVAQVGVTAAGVRVGTPAFMSPEQCDGVEVDFRSDIYNLGATAFLCLTGRLPFDGETPFAIMLKHKTEAVPSLCEIDPTIHREVDQLIKKLLAKKPADRCVGLRELIEDIEALETDLAGTDSVLRKSKGPFRALINGGPSPREMSPRPRIGQSDPVPVLDRVEVVDLPPAPPAIATAQGGSTSGSPGGSSSSGRRPSTGNLRRSRGSGLPAMIPPTPLDVAASPLPDKVGGRASRRLDSELQQARERGRRSQLDLTIASGDRLAEAGQTAEAAREWLAAADLASGDPGLQSELRRRAKSAKRRSGAIAVVRRLAILALCVVVAVGVVFAFTPMTHNWLVKQRLAVLMDGLGSVPLPRQRIAALREFQQSNNQPWSWYVATFQNDYKVDAADAAEVEAQRIEGQSVIAGPNPTTKGSDAAAEITAITTLAQNPTVPWEAVAEQSSTLLAAVRAQRRETPAYAPVIEAGKRAEVELAAQRTDIERIGQARAAGDHAKALELAGSFRTQHPRAFALLGRLPLAARVRIETPALALPADLALLVDGVAVPLAVVASGANGWPAAGALVCRSGERDTMIDLHADGFTNVRQTIPGSTAVDERLVPITLRQAPAWIVGYANPAAAGLFVSWARLHPLTGGLLIQHQDGLLVLRTADGAVAARLERSPTSPAFGALWYPIGGNRLLIAQSDGMVQVFGAATLIPEQTVHRGKGEVVAWADLDLALQNGRRIHVAAERVAGGCQLVAQDGDREYWRYANLKSATQQPQIIEHDDRLYVIDDQSLHLLEEDGTVVRVFALPAARVGPLVELPAAANRRDVLIPTVAGVQRLQFGTHQDPVRAVGDPVLGQIGTGQLATDGDTALVVSDRSAALLRFAPSATVGWRQDQSRPLGTLPLLTAAFAITVDDQGTLLIRDRATGKVLQRLVHGTPLVGMPLVIDLAAGPAVVVCDRAGQAAAYLIRR